MEVEEAAPTAVETPQAVPEEADVAPQAVPEEAEVAPEEEMREASQEGEESSDDDFGPSLADMK